MATATASIGAETPFYAARTDAYVLLTAADGDEPLQPDDLERCVTDLATTGTAAEPWTRAHNAFLNLGIWFHCAVD